MALSITQRYYLTTAISNKKIADEIADQIDLAGNGNIAMTSAQILVGGADGVGVAVAVTGDVAISAAGLTSVSAATVTGKLLTGFVAGAGTVAATDSILAGFNKLAGEMPLKLTADICAAQANSVAADVPAMVVDFNGLLAKLRTAGILDT